mgnify:CR=1 FL=1
MPRSRTRSGWTSPSPSRTPPWGSSRSQHEYRWQEAEASFERALELNANYATAHHWFSSLLAALGRHDEAIREIRRAEAIDPFSPIIRHERRDGALLGPPDDAAIAQCRTVLSREPDFWIAHWTRATRSDQTGNSHRGDPRASARRSRAKGATPPVLVPSLARIYALSGEREEADRLVAGLRGQSCVSLFHLATAHAALGERRCRLRCLGESCAQGELGGVPGRRSAARLAADDPRLLRWPNGSFLSAVRPLPVTGSLSIASQWDTTKAARSF